MVFTLHHRYRSSTGPEHQLLSFGDSPVAQEQPLLRVAFRIQTAYKLGFSDAVVHSFTQRAKDTRGRVRSGRFVTSQAISIFPGSASGYSAIDWRKQVLAMSAPEDLERDVTHSDFEAPDNHPPIPFDANSEPKKRGHSEG
jgi:hypothetical protein